MKSYEISVIYTGKFPNLCSGKWEITINGKRLVLNDNSTFETLITYGTWYFDENWNDIWEDETDGYTQSEWIEQILTEDINGLREALELNFGLCTPEELTPLLQQLYPEIQAEDYRSGSCGGCT